MQQSNNTEKDADPAVELGTLLAGLRERDEDLDDKGTAAKRANQPSARIYFETAGRHVYDRVEIVRDMLSAVEAQSLAGAAVQVAEAMNRIDSLWDSLPRNEDEVIHARDKRDMRAIERLLFSVLRVVEACKAETTETTVGDHTKFRHLDPWTPVEDRLRQLRAKGHSDWEPAR